MEYNRSVVVIDAVPQDQLRNINENVNNEVCIALLDDFTKNDYKSIFFLLMEFVKLENFFNLTKQDKCHQKRAFLQVCRNLNSNEILIELLGTMKMHRKLRLLGTCCHVYEELKERKFNQISKFWKMLYFLCEEITDEDLNSLKQSIPDNFKERISSAEDWFCWAILNKTFSENNLVKLENIFKDYDKCLNIIQNFQLKNKLYEIRTSTEVSNCGIAVIINFETFDRQSKLTERSGSDVDVGYLEKLWRQFGFQTIVYKNLSYQETLEWLKIYAKLDHSDYDAFVCCILSHGKANSIYTSDGLEVPILDLVGIITNEGISLASKPKLFFIQACQGSYLHQGVGKPVFKLSEASDNDDKVSFEMPPIMSDVLIAVSSITGYVSYRDTVLGSWFVEELYETMMHIGDKCSIHDVMTEVINKVNARNADYGPNGPRQAQQIPNCRYSLKKQLILKKRIK